MKKFLGAALLVLIAASGVRAADYTIKLGYIGSESHPTMTVMKDVFAKQIEEGSEGKIKMDSKLCRRRLLFHIPQGSLFPFRLSGKSSDRL